MPLTIRRHELSVLHNKLWFCTCTHHTTTLTLFRNQNATNIQINIMGLQASFSGLKRLFTLVIVQHIHVKSVCNNTKTFLYSFFPNADSNLLPFFTVLPLNHWLVFPIITNTVSFTFLNTPEENQNSIIKHKYISV